MPGRAGRTNETIKMLIRTVEFLMSPRQQSIGRVVRSRELAVLPAIIRCFSFHVSLFTLSSFFLRTQSFATRQALSAFSRVKLVSTIDFQELWLSFKKNN